MVKWAVFSGVTVYILRFCFGLCIMLYKIMTAEIMTAVCD